MTIDSGWIKLLKTNCPRAFSSHLPSVPHTVFIDGQIKLMKADSIRTWELFFKIQFEATIRKAFETGACVVVLGFDNYQHVPDAKAPTQRKRNKKAQSFDFGKDDTLPPVIPDCWMQAIRNRNFKVKVIRMVCQNLARLAVPKNHTLVIDWIDEPIVLGEQIDLPPACLDPNAARGECDIKAFNYTELGPLCIYSIDGDYVPLGILHHSQHPIYLYRYTTTIPVMHSTGVKRCRDPNQPKYEYVDISKLALYLQTELSGFVNPFQTFALLVSVTGCDFTLNLPRLGPAKLWAQRKMLQNLSFDDSQQLREMLQQYIIQQYLLMFASKSGLPKQLPANMNAAQLLDVHQRLEKHLIGLPSEVVWTWDRLQAHVKNSIWTVLYWTRLHEYPNPTTIDSEFGIRYGFVADSSGTTIFEAITKN